MACMRPPKQHDHPSLLIRDSDFKALLDACAGKDFDARRDTAIVRLFMNTGAAAVGDRRPCPRRRRLGPRRGARAPRGARDQVLPLGAKTVKALDRYLRAGRGHRDADSPAL